MTSIDTTRPAQRPGGTGYLPNISQRWGGRMRTRWFRALYQWPNTITSRTVTFCVSTNLVYSAGWWHTTGSGNLQSRDYRYQSGNSWVFTCYWRKKLKGKQQLAFIIQPYNPIWILEVSFIVAKIINNSSISYPTFANTQSIFLAAVLYFATSKYRACSQ